MSDAPFAPPPVAADRPKPRAARKAAQLLGTVALWIGGLFGGAGRLDWVRGWISLALYVAGMTAIGLVARHYNPELMEERAKWRRKNTKPFDVVFIRLLLPLTMLHPLVAGLDAARFRSTSMPFGLVYPGAILFAAAMSLIGWTFAVNRHAETTVRIQTDRGHTVVTTGPYQLVRHPMYVGAILMYLAIPLVWGSVWALALGAVIAGLFIWRTAREDETLQSELPGYKEFAGRTRYRLLPGLW